MAIYIPSALLAFCRGLLLPTLPIFADSFGVSLALVGLVLAAEGIGMVLFDLPAIAFINRLAPKTAMLVSASIMGSSMLLTALAPSLWLVIISLLLLGAGSSVWNISRHAYLAQHTGGGDRGRAIGLVAGISRLGVFVGPVVGGGLAALWGLRAPFFLYAAVLLAMVVLLAWLLKPEPRLRDDQHSKAEARAALRGSLPDLLNAGSAQLMGQALRAGRNVLIPLYGSQVLGLDVAALGVIVSVASLIDMSLFYPAGWVMDRFGRKAAIVPSFLLQGIAMALVPLAGGFAGLMAVAALGGLGNGLSSGTMMTLGADLAPRGALAEFLGLWRFIGDLGHMSGPLLVGFVAQAAGLGPSALAVGALGAGAALFFQRRVPETRSG